jgi:hypothetical protein
MELSQVYGGDSLKAADLQGREVPVVIANVQMKQFDDGNKLVISFQGKKKTLVCNKTNANRIAHMYGTNTDGWIGREDHLFADLVDFQGKPSRPSESGPRPIAAQFRRRLHSEQHVVTQRDGYRLMESKPMTLSRRQPEFGRQAASSMTTQFHFEN